MAKFSDQIKFGKCQAAYLKREAILDEIDKIVLSIAKLDQDNPKLRIFKRQETNANKSLEDLKAANIDLYILLEQANHNIKDDEEYIADKTRIIDKECSLINAIENHITLLNTKGIKYPPGR